MRRIMDAVGASTEPPTSLPASASEGADREAFVRELYEQHGADLLRYAARLLGGDWHQAEDVVQEAAARALNHLDILRDADAARPWLFTVVRNLVIDHHRSRQIRPTEVPATERPETPTADHIDRMLTSQVVRNALRELSAQHEEVIRLMHYSRYSVADAAEHLGVPPGTVKSRSYYAIRALKAALRTRGVLDGTV
ncbi:sigma-70 family RNA polymerase sigma factor [Streptomyces sp. NBC_00878]|uniref:sigma-70 family RNA polymerase sigma factor n=1 Tax=Streptomyces sp. NBC_00878 TaxID=2975854 RepID=UPI002251639D|nr:sigma-70 family RNA polymerase sigma factor [Streptomyces sp. NBC_00878]MCX4904375.1 sigma-70 family RNA polymerase sigma factor [Streptomyces sp. NBC_00878]